MQRQQRLHEVVPDRVFWYGPVVLLGLFYHCREVAASAVFHQNVEDSSFAIDVAVVVAYDVLVMQILENISMDTLATMPEGRAR